MSITEQHDVKTPPLGEVTLERDLRQLFQHAEGCYYTGLQSLTEVEKGYQHTGTGDFGQGGVNFRIVKRIYLFCPSCQVKKELKIS